MANGQFCPSLSTWLFLCSALTCVYSYSYAEVRVSEGASDSRTWREEWYRGMPIDHFSYSADDENRTFDLRYLVNDSWWDPNGGPIFLYTGNEGAAEDFAKHTGLMWDWAPEFRAMLVFAEHRYYGHSLPYGNQSFEMPYLSKLAVDQALADFGLLLTWIKSNVTGAAISPVIAFGGSYGGMLAAWSRVDHPNLISGAIASSAPIMALPKGGAPCHSFGETTVRAFAETQPGCDAMANKARWAITNLGSTEKGRKRLNEIFNFCEDSLIKNERQAAGLRFFVTQTWPTIAMYNYPYAVDFVRPLPAWPLKEVCASLTKPSNDDETLLSNAVEALRIYYNSTGTLKCFSWRGSTAGQTDYEATAWFFQECADLLLNNDCNNGQDIFKPYLFNVTLFSDSCFETYKVRPRWDWMTMNYGLERIRYATNIIFTSGHFDPWDGATIHEDALQGADPSLIAINIREGAHHYDLMGSHPSDTQEIIQVRDRMKQIVRGWIQAAVAKPPAPPILPIATPPPIDNALEANMSTPSVFEFEKLLAEGENTTTENATTAMSTPPATSMGTSAPPTSSEPAATTQTSVSAVATTRITSATGPLEQPSTSSSVAAPSVGAGRGYEAPPKIEYTKH